MNRKIITRLLVTMTIAAIFASIAIPVNAASLKKTALIINAPGNADSLQSYSIEGKLIDGTGAGVNDMKITIYKSNNGNKWTQVGSCLTSGGGYYSISTRESDAGNYIYKAVFSGNKVYSAASSEKVTVTVDSTKATSLKLEVTPLSMYVGDTITVKATLKDGAGTAIEGQLIKIIGVCEAGDDYVTSGSTLPDGSFSSTSWTISNTGKITWVATFTGGNGYAAGTSDSIQVVVIERPLSKTTLTLNLDPLSITDGESITFQGRLAGVDGTGIWGKSIQIQRYNPATYDWENLETAVTDGDGGYTKVIAPPSEGTYQYRAVFNGADGYGSATSSVKEAQVAFNPATTLDMSISPDVVYVGDVITLSGTLKDHAGVALPGKTIAIQVEQNSFWNTVGYVTTDSTGTYTYKQTMPDGITVKYRSGFEGSDGYASANSNEVILEILKMSTTVDHTISPNPAYAGDNILISGTLRDANGAGIPGKQIVIYKNNGIIGVAQTNYDGNYYYRAQADIARAAEYIVVFDGVEKYTGSTSRGSTLIINPRPTHVGLSLYPNPSVVGQPVTFVCGLTDLPTETGIQGQSIFLCVKNLDDPAAEWAYVSSLTDDGGGRYTYTTTTLVEGNFLFKAIYNGQGLLYGPATSEELNLEVNL